MAKWQMLKVAAVFVSLVASCSAAADSLCWYPDGVTTAPGHSPCNTTIAASSCCDPRDACTTSGLCLGASGWNYRGSCTDKTWTSSNCYSGCHSDPFNQVAYNSFTPLLPCGPLGTGSASYCCQSTNRNCCSIATFDFGNSGIAFKNGTDQTLLDLAAINTTQTVTTVTVTASAGTATSISSGTQANSEKDSSSNLALTVGVAVGVPLGILAIGIVAFLFWKHANQYPRDDMRGIQLDPNYSKPVIYSNQKPAPYYPPPSATATEVEGQPRTSKTSEASWPGNRPWGQGQRNPASSSNVRGVAPTGPHELI